MIPLCQTTELSFSDRYYLILIKQTAINLHILPSSGVYTSSSLPCMDTICAWIISVHTVVCVHVKLYILEDQHSGFLSVSFISLVQHSGLYRFERQGSIFLRLYVSSTGSINCKQVIGVSLYTQWLSLRHGGQSGTLILYFILSAGYFGHLSLK